MDYYLILAMSTVTIVVLTLLIWRRTKSVSFPLGFAIIYHMTLYGGWSLVSDKLGGGGKKNYEYLEIKLFQIDLDGYYLETLLIYSIFIIVIQICLLLFLKRPQKYDENTSAQVTVHHLTILIVSALAGIASFLLIKGDYQAALAMDMPAYMVMKRGLGEVSSGFTLHQVLHRVSSLSAMLGVAIIVSGKRPRLIKGRGKPWIVIGYIVVILGMVTLAFLLGYKSELLIPSMAAVLFYLANCERPRPFLVMATGTAVLAGMGLVDLARYVSLSDLSSMLSAVSIWDLGEAFRALSSTNEAFAGHFSLYGVLSRNVPQVYGYSLLSFLASFIPRLLWKDRPPDIYSYYAESVGAVEGQGYTVHHATGWYLNFGFAGVVIGAVLFALVWSKCFNGVRSVRSMRGKWGKIFYSVSPWLFVSHIPLIMRAGPEIYKSLLFEGFLFPVAILMLASLRWRFSRPAVMGQTAGKGNPLPVPTD